MFTLDVPDRPFRPLDTMRVGCTVASDGSWKSRMKLFPTCEYSTSASSRSLTTHWSLNWYVGDGPVRQPQAPYWLPTAFWMLVVSIGFRSLAPRAFLTFFENRL